MFARSWIALVMVVAPTASSGAAPAPVDGAAPTKTTPVAPPEPAVLRVFRFSAAAVARATRESAARAAMDEKQRAELLRRIDAYLARVDESLRADPITRDTSLATAEARAAAMRRDYEGSVEPWLEQHPAAVRAVQRQVSIGEAYARALETPQVIVDAAKSAGLPPARVAEATRAASERRQRFLEFQQAGRQRVAAAPAADAEASETAMGFDVQLQWVAAASDVRRLIEGMLPGPPERAKLDAAMLHWLEHSAPE